MRTLYQSMPITQHSETNTDVHVFMYISYLGTDTWESIYHPWTIQGGVR